MPRPNFFIVGAPKCGTTALSEYLRDHSDVFMCLPKEPHFFATDFPTHRYVTTEEKYLELFRNAGEGRRAIGEASSWYLYSREAAANIRRFDPNAKIIAMLRNPVDMVCSLHAQLLRDFVEDEPDLQRAWELQEERRELRCMPKHRNTRYDATTLLYGRAARFGEQVGRLLETFPREQVEIVLFDDLADDAKGVYERVLAFLGLPSDARQEFHVANPRRDFRSRGAARVLYEVWSLGSNLKRRLGIVETFGLWRYVEPFLWRRAESVTLAPQLRARLAGEFRPDVERLSELLGRDLSHWVA